MAFQRSKIFLCVCVLPADLSVHHKCVLPMVTKREWTGATDVSHHVLGIKTVSLQEQLLLIAEPPLQAHHKYFLNYFLGSYSKLLVGNRGLEKANKSNGSL